MKPLLLLPAILLIAGCTKNNPVYTPVSQSIEMARNFVPYKTEKYLRICYMLKTWEYEKQGLKLQRIVVFDNDTRVNLLTIDKADLPVIWKDPIPSSGGGQSDKLDHYYLSLQVPIPLADKVPAHLSHRFLLEDTVHHTDVTVEGGIVTPRSSETPRVIATPFRGSYYLVDNQSTLGYHYWIAFFLGGEIYTNEKFAFDMNQLSQAWDNTYDGDPTKNESYFAYGDTLYAVASGTVVKVTDGRGENNGNLRDLPLPTANDYYGNHLVIDIGQGVWAAYMHCLPGSIRVAVGDQVTEGEPIARLGNSGNSSEPHLHFQLNDQPDPTYCNGLPFVFKKCTKIGEILFTNPPGPSPITPIQVQNANLENWSVVNSIDN